jgi:hypothetical protein
VQQAPNVEPTLVFAGARPALVVLKMSVIMWEHVIVDAFPNKVYLSDKWPVKLNVINPKIRL